MVENDNIRTAVHVISGVYDGLFLAGDKVFTGLRQVAKEGVHKKYGEQAGQAVDQGIGIIGNVKDIGGVHKDVIREKVYKQCKGQE